MSEPAPRRPPACPICDRPRVETFRPFCSKRCADVDLNRWLVGVYAVPADPAEDRPKTEPEDED